MYRKFANYRDKISLAFRLGFFLAVRQIRRGSKWTTGLIIFVMMLTFLNLTVISGILVGLIEGSVEANRELYTSDIIISTLKEKNYIENSPSVLKIIGGLASVQDYTARYTENGTVEGTFKQRVDFTDAPNQAGAQFTGIDPVAENRVTGLANLVVEGEYLQPTDYDQLMLGSQLLRQYSNIDAPGFSVLENVHVGDKVRVKVDGITREFTVKGFVKSKVGEIELRAYFVDSQLRSLIGRGDYNVDEIAVKLKPGADVNAVKAQLLTYGIDKLAKVQTYEDAQPKFLKDIKATFALLGNMISSIGLVVASITVFIVIFINAITRRKFIGILKGIGIDYLVIEFAYVVQSLFYAIVGTAIGMVVLFGFLQPFIAAHPIDFPFSDGILVATWSGTLIRAAILLVATFIAGYVPAKIVVRQNTLDAILGR
jgi:ABC-type lipoprotein release transport system permease subunit